MPFTPDQPTIPLATLGDCPHCQRPVLSLAEDRCGFCGLSLEAGFAEFPEVVSRLNALARGWTPARLAEWLRPRPLDLAWAQSNGLWRNLGWFVHPELWLGWANGLASLRGRGRERWADGTEVLQVRVAGIGTESPWVKLRVRGRRWSLPWLPESGWDEEGMPELRAFSELWTLSPTGEPDAPPRCGGCGGELSLQQAQCGYCGAPSVFQPGPWLLHALRADPGPRGGRAPSPFEGAVDWTG